MLEDNGESDRLLEPDEVLVRARIAAEPEGAVRRRLHQVHRADQGAFQLVEHQPEDLLAQERQERLHRRRHVPVPELDA